MEDQNQPKSSVEEIRKRFDANVERFSNLETGQAATVDSPLAMALIAEAAAAAVTPNAVSVLDVGCGAGNYSLKLLERLPNLNVMLVDLSRPMLDRAMDRIRPATIGSAEAIQGDIREIDIGIERYDIVLAASVLHHLRSGAQWQAVFEKFYRTLRPGGSIWIFDLIESSIPESTSAAKIVPASGARKIAPIPAPMPAAMSTRRRRDATVAYCPAGNQTRPRSGQ